MRRRTFVSMTGLTAASLLTAGATTAHAEDEAHTCPPPNPAMPKRQLRSYWIASVTNIDWPSRTGRTLQNFTDSTAVAGQRYTYAISALDRVANESRPSEAVSLRAAR